jgi:glycosyltransferase involved in cell wall biosynthesis
VVGPGGILLEPVMQTTVPNGSDLWISDVPAFSDAIERVYESKGLRRDLGEAAREHVLANFKWDTAAERFDMFINALAVGAPEPVAVAS